MLLTMLVLVSLNSTAKTLTSSFPPLQIVWARYFFHTVFVLVLIVPRGNVFRTRFPAIQAVRSMLIFGGTFLYFYGLKFMPLTSAIAILSLAPILTIAFSVPILKERINTRQAISVAFGLAGALIIIRPGLGVFQWTSLLPVGAALCYGVFQVLTRYLSRHDEPLTTLAWSAAGGTVVASLMVPMEWVTPQPQEWLGLAALGGIAALGQYTLIRAWGHAPASVLAPFNYTNLLWSVPFGFFLFGDLPDRWTILGALIIVGSGIYVTRRHRS